VKARLVVLGIAAGEALIGGDWQTLLFGTCEGSVPTKRRNHPSGGGGPIKMIRAKSGWPREGDYHCTRGRCIAIAFPGVTPL
jgi:hypothetical protein